MIVSLGRRFTKQARVSWPAMAAVPVLRYEGVLAAVSSRAAIAHVREGLIRFHRGEWRMPPKVYLESPPFGDFRAMPASGDGLALLKWVTSFPGNPTRGLPTVTAVICLSDAMTGELRMLLDGRSVTALRTGAVAAVATAALASPTARSVGILGCGLHGAWTARCLADAGFQSGVCHDVSREAADRLAFELGPGWRVGDRAEALHCDVACCITPGHAVVVREGDLRPGMHLNMLGADGPGKSEATIEAVVSCELFCDEWQQASHGGELTAAVQAGRVTRERVTELGAVLACDAPGRRSSDVVTLFDSTGLAIQDLAVAAAAFEAWRDGRVEAQTVRL
jgi:alanine dehydrogenase